MSSYLLWKLKDLTFVSMQKFLLLRALVLRLFWWKEVFELFDTNTVRELSHE